VPRRRPRISAAENTEKPRPVATTTTGSGWAPLRRSTFRALWIAQFVSNVGGWMQTVGAQWVLLGHGSAEVALVQTAASLPVFLLALPAGALADLVDRRRVLLWCQVGMTLLATVLAILAFTGHLAPTPLLGITFLLGCCTAVNSPAWQAIQPTLVPAGELRQASSLGAVNMNVARAVGPALGGVVVAAAGIGWTFAFNAVSFLGTLYVVARRLPADTRRRGAGRDEHAIAALRAGGGYVLNSPVVRRILLRALLFLPAASAVWALLPVMAREFLGMGSGGYGLLLGAVGVGALGMAFVLPQASNKLGGNGLLAASGLAFAVGLAVLAAVHEVAAAVLALAVIGAAWIGALSTLNASMQLFLPSWVRARGLAYYLMVFQGGQAFGALAWGVLAQHIGLARAGLAAAGLMAVGALTVRLWPLKQTDGADRGVWDRWPEPAVVLEPEPTDGPVLVLVEYDVAAERQAAFTEAMRLVERSRRRTGAATWSLYQDPANPGVLIEAFQVRSWSEHLAQHHVRYTGLDGSFEEQARALIEGEPRVRHVVALDV